MSPFLVRPCTRKLNGTITEKIYRGEQQSFYTRAVTRAASTIRAVFREMRDFYRGQMFFISWRGAVVHQNTRKPLRDEWKEMKGGLREFGAKAAWKRAIMS